MLHGLREYELVRNIAMAIAQFRDVASSAHVRTKQMKRKKYQRRGKAVAEKPLQLLHVMLLDK